MKTRVTPLNTVTSLELILCTIVCRIMKNEKRIGRVSNINGLQNYKTGQYCVKLRFPTVGHARVPHFLEKKPLLLLFIFDHFVRFLFKGGFNFLFERFCLNIGVQ